MPTFVGVFQRWDIRTAVVSVEAETKEQAEEILESEMVLQRVDELIEDTDLIEQETLELVDVSPIDPEIADIVLELGPLDHPINRS